MRGAFDLGEIVIERTLSNPQILRGFNDGSPSLAQAKRFLEFCFVDGSSTFVCASSFGLLNALTLAFFDETAFKLSNRTEQLQQEYGHR